MKNLTKEEIMVEDWDVGKEPAEENYYCCMCGEKIHEDKNLCENCEEIIESEITWICTQYHISEECVLDGLLAYIDNH